MDSVAKVVYLDSMLLFLEFREDSLFEAYASVV